MDKTLQFKDNPLHHTQAVFLELSNLCNYAGCHKACPAHKLQENPTILPSEIVYHVLDTLGSYGYSRNLRFHNYNEPLIDPRLFEYVRYAKWVCPHSDILITTNGYYLNQQLANELVEAGVSGFIVSAYSDQEMTRLKSIKLPGPSKVIRMTLDDRLSIYDRDDMACDKPCYAPLGEIIIAADGTIPLCCLDWGHESCFGNLHETSLADILQNPEMWSTFERLSGGDRFLNMCRHCSWSRGQPTQDNKSIPQKQEHEQGKQNAAEVAGVNGSYVFDATAELAKFTSVFHNTAKHRWFHQDPGHLLFANALRCEDLNNNVFDVLKHGGRIWEFCTGTADVSLALAAQGCRVSCSELNSVQKDFIRYRFYTHKLPVQIIETWEQKPVNEFDMVIAGDMLEYFPDHGNILNGLCDSVKEGGIFWESFTLGKDNSTKGTGVRNDYKKIVSEKGFKRVYENLTGKLWAKRSTAIINKQAINPKEVSSAAAQAGIKEPQAEYYLGRAIEGSNSQNFELAFEYLQDVSDIQPAAVTDMCIMLFKVLPKQQVSRLIQIAHDIKAKRIENKYGLAGALIACFDAHCILTNGVSKLQRGEFSDALIDFEQAGEKVSTLATLNYAKAVAFAQLGKFGSAKMACIAELKIRPDHAGSLELLPKLEAAIAEYERYESQTACGNK